MKVIIPSKNDMTYCIFAFLSALPSDVPYYIIKDKYYCDKITFCLFPEFQKPPMEIPQKAFLFITALPQPLFQLLLFSI